MDSTPRDQESADEIISDGRRPELPAWIVDVDINTEIHSGAGFDIEARDEGRFLAPFGLVVGAPAPFVLCNHMSPPNTAWPRARARSRARRAVGQCGVYKPPNCRLSV